MAPRLKIYLFFFLLLCEIAHASALAPCGVPVDIDDGWVTTTPQDAGFAPH